MKITGNTLHRGYVSNKQPRIPHMVCPDDFNTNYPNPNRIGRIAREIDEYLRYKHKHMDVQEANKCAKSLIMRN